MEYPAFGRRGGSVSYMDARKKRSRNAVPACALLVNNVRNGFPTRSVTKIPLVMIYLKNVDLLARIMDIRRMKT
jgi:hypothetical protein